METKLQRFAKVMFNYGVDRKRFYLRKWYLNSMNYIHESYKKLNLVSYGVAKKRKIKFFYKWRQAFLQNKKDYDSKIDGLKLMRKVMCGK
jgi:hypothetical protein